MNGALVSRLTWLLVFRACVAVAILVLTLVADLADWPLRRISPLLYGVVIGTFVIVLLLGLLLRTPAQRSVIASAHLATVVMAAVVVVHGTGGVRSGFTFLFLLAILDGAILGGQTVALIIASASIITFGTQLGLQLYGLIPGALEGMPPPSAFTSAFVAHLAAFYLVAVLAGHLARLWQRADAALVQAADSLEELTAQHALVLDSLPVGVLTLSRGEQIRMANPAAARILQRDSVSLVGGAIPAELGTFLEDERSHAEHVVELGAERHYLSVSRSPLLSSPAGEALEGDEVLVLEDRTQIRELEASLAAKERLASVGQFAASIAHEIRNPLAAISGAVEMWREGGVDKRTTERLSTIVLREIERLKGLVNDFLSYARATPAAFERADVAALVRDTCETVSQDAETWASIVLQVCVPPRLLAAVDPVQLQQVVWNLLKNAAESGSNEVEVIVREQSNPGGVEGFIICVADRGCGFSEAQEQRLFEPFFTTKSSGTGLGLSLVQSILGAHGGNVVLSRRTGGGAEMCTWWPRDHVEVAGEGARETAAHHGVAGAEPDSARDDGAA